MVCPDDYGLPVPLGLPRIYPLHVSTVVTNAPDATGEIMPSRRRHTPNLHRRPGWAWEQVRRRRGYRSMSPPDEISISL
jgi:hypothetical protein